MITLHNKTFKSQEVLSSINFMKISNLIFIASLTLEDIDNLGLKEYRVLEKNNEMYTILNLKFTLKENDVIYCHSDYVESLFNVLKNLNFKNIKLLSSQSDRKIDKKLFLKKAKCISKWYSTNVCFDHKSLISIPLGIAPYRNTKSAIIQDFEISDESILRSEYLYVNFSLYTNYFHRFNALKNVKKKLNLNLIENIDYSQYVKVLRRYQFTLCPWGNGIDTHRFWEALYSGSIPVTKKHKLFESFDGLPMVLIDSYKEVDSIDNKLKFEDFDLSKLNINWWIQKIESDKIQSKVEDIKFYLNDEIYNYTVEQLDKVKIYNQRKKKKMTFLRKAHEKLIPLV